MTRQTAVFQEIQRVGESGWVTTVVYGTAAIAWIGFVQQIVLRRPFGAQPGPDWIMWLLWLVFGLGVPAFIRVARLIVEVLDDRVVIRYVPLTRREILRADIRRCEVRVYRPVWEYGGWGVKGWSRRHMSYTVRGHRGVQLELRDARTILIGSQAPEDLARAIAAGQAGGPVATAGDPR